MIGTMTTPPICWATRGSLTRALTMTPATTDDEPDGRAEQEHAGQPRRIGHDAEQRRAVDERRQRHEDDVGHPAREHARHEGGDRLAGQQLDGPDRRGEHRLERARLLLADDRERRDRQRDVRRHQQEEHEELLDRERAGQLAGRERGPLRAAGRGPAASSSGGSARSPTARGQQDRGDGQEAPAAGRSSTAAAGCGASRSTPGAGPSRRSTARISRGPRRRRRPAHAHDLEVDLLERRPAPVADLDDVGAGRDERADDRRARPTRGRRRTDRQARRRASPTPRTPCDRADARRPARRTRRRRPDGRTGRDLPRAPRRRAGRVDAQEPAADEGDAVAQPVGLVEVVRREHDRPARPGGASRSPRAR